MEIEEFDCLVGVNLLREGPEVSLVAIFDADKEGFLRSQTSLIQVSGRVSAQHQRPGHHVRGPCQRMMEATIRECDRRRKVQTAFNKEHGITPQTIQKAIRNGIEELSREEAQELVFAVAGQNEEEYTLANHIARMEREWNWRARNLQFERAPCSGTRSKRSKAEK